MTKYGILLTLWIVWCCLHSFMISLTITGFVRTHLERGYRYYRIFFNFIALVTLVPVLVYAYSIKGVPVFNWEGPFRIVRLLMAASALVLFIGGAGRYDLGRFLGTRQVRENASCSVLKEDCSLDTDGILGLVRHPWYAGGILIIWAGNLDTAAIVTNLVLTGYFIIGALLEERKLAAEFGKEYRDYQKRVSMLFPFKWVLQKSRVGRNRN